MGEEGGEISLSLRTEKEEGKKGSGGGRVEGDGGGG